jgi:hypothetical protein
MADRNTHQLTERGDSDAYRESRIAVSQFGNLEFLILRELRLDSLHEFRCIRNCIG